MDKSSCGNNINLKYMRHICIPSYEGYIDVEKICSRDRETRNGMHRFIFVPFVTYLTRLIDTKLEIE